MSLPALAIDTILPALSEMGESLNILEPSKTQFFISSVFLGMSGGLMVYGPLSDSFGRKKMIYLGIFIFLIGSFLSFVGKSFSLVLWGRFLQGFGAASPRVLTLSMVRDKFEGREMAQIISLILVVFTIVPAIAPLIGQGILYFFNNWRVIFLFFLLVGILGFLGLYIRQEETLKKEHKKNFTFLGVWRGIKEVLSHRKTLGYTIASGIIFGAFVGYLASVQPILQIQYKVGDKFSLYFGSLAIGIGLASFVNSKLVMKWTMEKLCVWALSILILTSFCFLLYAKAYHGQPPLHFLILALLLIFFCFGILFGNYNALAISPMGHIAGMANSVISSLQTLISAFLGAIIGYFYNGTVTPLFLGFLVLGILAFTLTFWTLKGD